MGAVIVWILEAIASYAFKGVVSRIGHTQAASHMMTVIENAKPLPKDLTPAQERNPNFTNLG
jgi:hypothetical protein